MSSSPSVESLGTTSNAAQDPATGFIDRQLSRATAQIRLFDFLGGILLWCSAVLGLLLCVAIVDAWIYPLGTLARWGVLLSLILGSLAFLAYRLLPLLIRRINPMYAARMLEEGHPELKDGLVNVLSLREAPGLVRQRIFSLLTMRAASDLSQLRIDTAIDRSYVIRIGYVLAGLMAFAAAYKILSPKDPVTTLTRIAAPSADVPPPSRVRIVSVAPGDATVKFGDSLAIEVEVEGLSNQSTAILRYTTDDQQAIDLSFPLAWNETDRVYQGELSPTSTGIEGSLSYVIEAGDARSRSYRVEVASRPTTSVVHVLVKPQPYTALPERSWTDRGDIDGLEGSEIQITAKANVPVTKMTLELLSPSSDAATNAQRAAVKKIPMTLDGTQGTASFRLELNEDRVTPKFDAYRVQLLTEGGEIDSEPIEYRIAVFPDLAPSIRWLAPTETELRLGLEERLELQTEAFDADFHISKVMLVGEVRGNRFHSEQLLDASQTRDDRHLGRFRFQPSNYQLKPGDTVILYAEAYDDRHHPLTSQLDPNLAQTERLVIQIEAPREGAGQNSGNSGNNSGAASDNSDPNAPQNGANENNSDPQGNSGGSPQAGEQGEGSEAGEESGEGAGGGGGSGSEQQPNEQGEGGTNPQQGMGGGSGQAGESSQESSQGGGGGNRSSNNSNGESSNSNAGNSSGDSSSAAGESSSDPMGGDGANSDSRSPAPSNGQGSAGNEGGEPDANATESPDGAGDGAAGSSQPNSGTAGNSGSQRSTSPDANQATPESGDPSGANEPNDAGDGSAGSSSAPENQGPPKHEGEAFERILERMRREGKTDDLDQSSGSNQGQGESASTSGQSGNPSTPNENGSNNPNRNNSNSPAGNDASGAGNDTPMNSGSNGNQNSAQNAGNPDGSNQGADPQNNSGSTGRPEGNDPMNSAGGSSAGESDQNGGGNRDPQSSNDPAGAQASGDNSETQPSGAGDGTNNRPEAGNSTSGESQSGESQGSNSESGMPTPSGSESGDESSPGSQPSNPANGNSQGEASQGENGQGEASQSGGPQGNSPNANDSSGATRQPNESMDPAGSEAGSEEQGDDRGSESGESNSEASGNRDSSTGDSSRAEGNRNDGQQGDARNRDAQSSGARPGDRERTSARASNPDGELPPSEAANLEYAQRATDLVLEYLKDQEQAPDPELLRELDWTPDQLKQFMERWQQMRDAARQGLTSDQKRLNDRLRSLGLLPPGGDPRRIERGSDAVRNLGQDGARTAPPPEFAEKFRQFQRGVSQSESDRNRAASPAVPSDR